MAISLRGGCFFVVIVVKHKCLFHILINTSAYFISHYLRLRDFVAHKVSMTDYIDTTQWLQAAKQHTSCEHKKKEDGV